MGELTADQVRQLEDARQQEQQTQTEEQLAQMDKLLSTAEKLVHPAKGEVQDLNLARDKLKQAYQSGSGAAATKLGEIDLFEDANPAAAASWFHLGAERGDASAQHYLGFLYSVGVGVEGGPDPAKAVLFDYFSAMGNNSQAKMSLGYRHLQGYGVPKSCESAVLYYSQVAETVVQGLANNPVSPLLERQRLSDEASRSQAPEEDEDVIQYYRLSADNGETTAQVALGHLFYYGARGVAQDLVTAARYYTAAAEAGDANAMASLGQMHLKGYGVSKSNETALLYFTRAAKQGNLQAQNGLGFIHLNGFGVPKDTKAALRFFKKAAGEGHAEAQFNLGALYFAGNGVEKKYSTAMQYFSLAAHQGHTRALYNLAQMHLNGLGTMRSCGVGAKLLKTVAERGPWAKSLADAHKMLLAGKTAQAGYLYALAAEEGCELAQSNSAWVQDEATAWEEGGAGAGQSADAVLALRHLTLASEQGNVDAYRKLGDFYYYGVVERADPQQAAKYYLLGSNNRNAQAMFNLGLMHEEGVGLPQDFNLAKRYYDSALEADTDALVPVYLALAKLWVRQQSRLFSAWWNGGAAEADQAHVSDQQPPPPTAAASGGSSEGSPPAPPPGSPTSAADLQNPPPIEGGNKGPRRAGSSGRIAHKATEYYMELLKKYNQFVATFNSDKLALEDVVLLVLCGSLAILVFFRMQRPPE